MGSTMSTIMKAANSHRTGLVQSVLARGVAMLVVMVMRLSVSVSTACATALPPPERGRVGEGVRCYDDAANRIPSRRFAPTSPFQGEVNPHQSLHPKQPRIAHLDLVRHCLDSCRILLHQLDLRDLAAAGLWRHLRMNRILRGEVGEELLRFAGVQPGLKQPCRIRMRRGDEDPGRAGNCRRALDWI